MANLSSFPTQSIYQRKPIFCQNNISTSQRIQQSIQATTPPTLSRSTRRIGLHQVIQDSPSLSTQESSSFETADLFRSPPSSPSQVGLIQRPLPRALAKRRIKSEKGMGNVMMQRSAEGSDQHIVFLGNLPFKARWQDLKDLVRGITPNIERAEIYLYPDGKSRGHGYVRIRGRAEAEKASNKLNGYAWEGRALITKMMDSGYCPIATNGSPSKNNYHQSPASTSKIQPVVINDPLDCYLPYLPPEYLDKDAMARAISADAKPYEVWSQQAGINMQAHLHFHASAAAYAFKAEQAKVSCEEARLVGNFEKVNELHSLYAFYLEKQNQLLLQACSAFQLAQEQVDKANNLRRAEGLRALPRYTIQPYPLVPPAIPNTGNGYGPVPGHIYMPAMPAMPNAVHGAMLPQIPNSQGMPLPTLNGGTPSYSPISAQAEQAMFPYNPEYIHVPPTPVIVKPPNGLPVNLSHGAVQTECRGVFVGNLHFDTTWREVKEQFRTCGNISRVEIPPGADGKPKGHAIVLFENVNDAEKACLRFDRATFKGRQLRVRMDKHCSTKKVKNWQSRANPQHGHDENTKGSQDEGTSSRSASAAGSSVYRPPVVVHSSLSSTSSQNGI